MTLRTIVLRPFAGIASREVSFDPSLTVILGPNEAGKTTLYRAIQHALYTRCDLTPAKFEREMGRFLPIGGGDTIAVELAFASGGKELLLKKRWGAGRSAELVLPGGRAVRGEEEIARLVDSFIPVKEGTCKLVLMSSQTELSRTIEDLKVPESETLHSLGDILRRSILETDGISVGRFKSRLEAAYEGYYSRWDMHAGLPEKGKGIRNRYTKNVGKVLAAYYDKEDLREALAGAREYEETLDRLNGDLLRLAQQDAEKVRFLEEWRGAVDAAGKRREYRLERETVGGRAEEMREANRTWPVFENRLASDGELRRTLEERRNVLSRELGEAQEEERRKARRDDCSRIRSLKADADKLGRALESVRKITREEFEELRETQGLCDTLRARLASGALNLSFSALRAVSLTLRSDGGPPVPRELAKGETLELRGAARVGVSHADWSLEVSSGEAGEGKPSAVNATAAERLKAFEAADERVRPLMAACGVSTLSEASEVNRVYEKALQSQREAQNALRKELRGREYAEIERDAAVLGEPRPARPLAEILAEHGTVQGKISRLEAEISSMKKTLDGYAQKFGDQDRLLLEVSKNVTREAELKTLIASLPPLPGEMKDEDELIAAYNGAREAHESLNGRVKELEVQIARHEGRGQEGAYRDFSTEELALKLVEAEERFARVSRAAEAVGRIGALTEKIMREIDRSTYAGIRQKLEGYVAALTDNRHTTLAMSESLPEGFVTTEGRTLGYTLLSTGTKDVLALALRLAMAEYFLEGADGFVAMDDPFVNLDPDRQKKAAELIRSFAERKQVLLFTCHPRVAELLDADPVRL